MILTGKKRVVTATLVLGLMLSGATQAHAALIYYTNQASFTAAQPSSAFIGTETFEQSTLAANNYQYFNDPLKQGVANGPFPAGLVQPLTIQSNTRGASANTTSPRGTQGLTALSAGVGGVTSDVVTNNFYSDSLDLIFTPAQSISAVGFNPLVLPGSGTMQVQVYDINNVLLGTTTASATPGGTTYYSIQATGTDLIGRINLFSNYSSQFTGVDNISIYATPEPETWAMMGLGIIAMGVIVWRRKHEEDEGSVEVSELVF